MITTTLPERDGFTRRGSITIVPVVGVYTVILDLPTVDHQYRPMLRLRVGEFIGAITHDGDGRWSGSITIHGYKWTVAYTADPPYTLSLTG